ncbi:MAG: hypothetical protein NC247_06270 [Ruminococcus flavefaciens]|nr:hypothetical protein [Ruminococcus flavefaciens]MCM1380758.1 hypothetical protein [Muribaculaceae bacterium]MCM1479394.1 hypothetical protein [Muribaculaceae bacterium]
MKKKFIAYEKMSKKAKRAIDNKARKSWGAINPVVRIADTSAAYRNRKRGNSTIDM